MATFALIGPGGVVENVVVGDSIEWLIDHVGGVWREVQEQDMAAATKAIQLPEPTQINRKPTTGQLAIDEVIVRPRRRYLAITYLAVDETGNQVEDGERVQEVAEGAEYDALTKLLAGPTVELGLQLLILKGRIDPASTVVDVKR